MTDLYYIASLYPAIFTAVMIVLAVFGSFAIAKSRFAVNDKSILYALFWGLVFTLFFGLRPPVLSYALGDTYTYLGSYNAALAGRDLFADAENEYIWAFIEQTCANLGFSANGWFTVIAAIYLGFNIWGVRRVFYGQEYFALLFYIVFFLFYSGGTNGIRNADAYSIVFFAISLFTQPCRRNYILAAILCLIAFYIHTSVMITIAGLIGALFLVKTTNKALLVWFAAILIALIGGNYLAEFATNYFALEDERLSSYLEGGKDVEELAKGFSHVGFRWDFLLFSAPPIAIGWYVTEVKKVKDRMFQLLLNTYILANAIWIIFIYAAFSNRFAMLSWCIYPYVLCYPFLKMNIWGDNRVLFTNLALWTMAIFTLII